MPDVGYRPKQSDPDSGAEATPDQAPTDYGSNAAVQDELLNTAAAPEGSVENPIDLDAWAREGSTENPIDLDAWSEQNDSPFGGYVFPDGFVVQEDGSLKPPEPRVVFPDGAGVLPDGSLQLPDGTVIPPGG